ncbi:lantibiotic dehydratase [Lysinibacillus mangiferihumi]|nr:lantibiotic dehydratase [Lysinibacillus mangiferihumi]
MENLYETFNHFIVRAPVYKIQDFKGFHLKNKNENNIMGIMEEFKKDSIFMESLLVANSALYYMLIDLDNLDKKRLEKLFKSTSRYYCRMCSRSTPFGLFAGITTGKYVENKNNVIKFNEPKSHTKRARVDMEWLTKIVIYIENNLESIFNLKVYRNPLLFNEGNKLTLINSIRKYKENNTNPLLINVTKPIKIVLNYLYENKLVEGKRLIEELKIYYPEESNYSLSQFLHILLKEEILLSTLRPPLLDVDPLDYVIESLSNLTEYSNLRGDLLDIKKCIEVYNNTDLGKGIEEFEKIVNKMEKLSRSSHYLQVDLYLNFKKLELSSKLKKDLTIASRLLLSLSPNNTTPSLWKDFIEEFEDNYGTDAEVPIMQLNDVFHKLEANKGYSSIKKKSTLASFGYDRHRRNLFISYFIAALKNNSEEIVFDEEFIQEFEYYIQENELPDTFEIHASLMNGSKNDYKLVLGSMAGYATAGQNIGRFLDGIDRSVVEELTETFKLQSENSDTIFAETVYFPSDSRLSNISITKNLRSHEINLGTSTVNYQNTIELNDLVVGVCDDKIYLRSLSMNKEIIPTKNHLLNIAENIPNITKFLYQIYYQNTKIAAGFNVMEIIESPYIPRIRYKNIILSPARWKIENKSNNFSISMSFNNWMKSLKILRMEYHIPRYIYKYDIENDGNRQLFDLDCLDLLKELFFEFKKFGFLFFEEAIGIAENMEHNVDFIFPMKKTSFKEKHNIDKKRINCLNNNKIFFPGSEWLYFKFYINPTRYDEILGIKLRDLSEYLSKKNLINKSFFIRYQDPKDHIRYRVKITSMSNLGIIIKYVKLWAEVLREEGLLNTFHIAPYKPEIARFGGPNIFQHVEDVFTVDSIALSKLIQMKYNNELQFTEEILGVILIIYTLEAFSIPTDEQITILKSVKVKQNHNNRFRLLRAKIETLIQPLNWSNLNTTEKGKKVLETLNERNEAVYQLSEKLNLSDNEQNYTNIVHSIIHLSINRLFGIDKEFENTILAISYLTLNNFKYKNSK